MHLFVIAIPDVVSSSEVHSKSQAKAASSEVKLDTDISELGSRELHDILEHKGT